MHYFSIQYAILNDQYPKTLQKAVDVIRKVKFKSKNNNKKVIHKNMIKMEVVKEIS